MALRGFINGYLCRAWGETDHTEAEFVTTLEDAERFIVEAQFGDHRLVSELEDLHEENVAMLSEQITAMRDTLINDNDTWQIEFEIGGISVERVAFAQDVSGVQPTSRRSA